MTREAMDLCLRLLKESNKSRFDSYSVRNSVLIISHITFRDCRVHISLATTFLEIAVFRRQSGRLASASDSQVRDPLWSLARFVLGCPEFKTYATRTRSACKVQ